MAAIDWERINRIKAEAWTREQYEEAMRAEGIDPEPRTDRGVRTIVAYSDDIATPFYAFAVARLNGIKQEIAARPKQPVVTAAPPELVLCSCGHEVPRILVMNASLGSSCPDCYDRLSDGNDGSYRGGTYDSR